MLLGVERSNSLLFQGNLPILLRQVQVVAFAGKVGIALLKTCLLMSGPGQDKTVARESLLSAMWMYSPSEKTTSCQFILESTHDVFAASLKLCETKHAQLEGVAWVCFIIEHIPMVRYFRSIIFPFSFRV